MNIIYKTDELESTSKTGLSKYWIGLVLEEDGTYYTSSKYWHKKEDGTLSKVIESTPIEVSGKNIGKKNETSPKDQAILEIQSLENLKKKKGYHPLGVGLISSSPSVMLAKNFNSKKLSKVAYLQPKLDGMRAARGLNGNLYSRNGDVIKNHPSFEIPDCKYELDGELLLPYPYTFQQTISAIKKERDDTAKLEYWVFDLMDPSNPSLTFSERLEILKSLDIGKARLVPTEKVSEPSQLYFENAMFSYINKGYEGLMIRLDDPYCFGHRSYSLMKMKNFDDSEFKIVGGKEGVGNDEGCVIFVCEMLGGQTFDVRPRGTVDYRKDLLTNIDKYIGKRLTVRHQGYTDDSLPRFPVGLAVRDYE